MKIIVCDDEPKVRRQIQRLILQEDHEAKVKLCGSAEEVLQKPDADLIMFDVQLENMNGIEAARKLREDGYDVPIIFFSGIKDYVFDVFDVKAFWYLVKPIEENRFHYVYEKVKHEIRQRKQEDTETILFTTRKRNYSVKRCQIVYAENEGKKIVLHTTGGQIELYASMAEMEKRLGAGFFRCHRGFLVNMDHIFSYSGEAITVSSGEEIFLARERYREFVEKYMKYLRE